MSFDVNAAIGDYLELCQRQRPRDIAAAVAELVPEDELRLVLARALTLVVQRQVHERRDRARAAVADHNSQANGAGSALMRQSVCAGRAWKPLAECTAADLQSMAEFRIEMNAKNTAEVVRYERLIRLLVAGRLRTLGELDEEEVVQILA